MRTETKSTEKGTRISVESDSKVAVVVRDSEGERIYLPESKGSDSSYYVEEVESLQSTSKGFEVVHPREVESFEVLG